MFKSKNIKGLTLVEVLVSVVITILVMLYGMTLFISAWRLEVDSEEYEKVLQYVNNTIEGYKRYIDPLGPPINPITKELDLISLPSGKRLKQTVKIYAVSNDETKSEYKTVPIAVIAQWPVDAKKNQKVETIVVNTHLGVNGNLDFTNGCVYQK